MLWSGRFSKKTHENVLSFTRSIERDIRLYPYDIMGSIAHVKSLASIRVISKKETTAIINNLKIIEKELDKNKFTFLPTDEDIHMAIERRLIEKIGAVGKKLHTGRSRNDQVSLDMRMYLRDAILILINEIENMQNALLTTAEKHLSFVMPGYTHLQQAQPVLFSHYLLSFVQMFERDIDRYKDAFKRSNVFPLGSGALSGTPYSINRKAVAKELGFPQVTENSMDTVSDRDFILDFLYASSVFAIHCSRLSEDFIIWSSQEFGFIEFDDAYTTGSSIMPQKKNPDVLELIRGKTQRITGSLNAFLNVMKGLPLTYNRDMQEDKHYLFTTIDVLLDFLQILPNLIRTMAVNKNRMKTALDQGYLYATVIADYLVRKKVPFREAHRITGELVSYAIKHKKTFLQLTIDDFKKFSNKFSVDILKLFDPLKIVDSNVIDAGTSTRSVKKQIARIKKKTRNR